MINDQNINEIEYKILKDLQANGFKWIARDSELYAYKTESRLMQRNSLGGKASFLPKHFYGAKELDGKLFPHIRKSDRPFNIDNLIKIRDMHTNPSTSMEEAVKNIHQIKEVFKGIKKGDSDNMAFHVEINNDEYKLLMDLEEKGYTRLMASRIMERNHNSREVITIVAYNSAKHEYLTADSFSFMDDPKMNFSINELIKLYRKENGLALATGAVTIDTEMVQSEEYQKQLKKSREARERSRQRESLLNEIHAGNSSLERVSDMIDEIVEIDEAVLLNRIINNGKFKVADGTYLVISQPVLPEFAADYLESMKNKGSDLALSMQGSYGLVEEWLFEEEDGIDNQIQYALSYFNDYTIDPDSIPKYFALIKGHDRISHDDKYWNYDTVDKTLEVGDNKVHKDVERDYILMATMEEWNELGINEDNTEFELVEK